MMEAAHKFMVKDFYDLTNKSETYQDQIAEHLTRTINIQAMKAMILHCLGNPCSSAQPVNVQTTTICRDPIMLSKIGWRCLDGNRRKNLKELGFDLKTTTTACCLETSSSLKNFTEALAVFSQYNRDVRDKKQVRNEQLDKRLHDSAWVNGFPCQVHSSLTCWKRTGNNYKETEQLESDYDVRHDGGMAFLGMTTVGFKSTHLATYRPMEILRQTP